MPKLKFELGTSWIIADSRGPQCDGQKHNCAHLPFPCIHFLESEWGQVVLLPRMASNRLLKIQLSVQIKITLFWPVLVFILSHSSFTVSF